MLGRLKCYKYLLRCIMKRFNYEYLKKYYPVMRSFQRTAYSAVEYQQKCYVLFLLVLSGKCLGYPSVPLTEQAKPKMLYKDFLKL